MVEENKPTLQEMVKEILSKYPEAIIDLEYLMAKRDEKSAWKIVTDRYGIKL